MNWRGAACVAFVAVAGCSKGSGPASDSLSARSGSPTDSSSAAVGSHPRSTILFIGTSLTAGLGLAPDSAFPQLIQRKIDAEGLPFRVENAGESGETTGDLIQRLDWVLKGTFGTIVLETGANDGLRGIPPATVRANLDAIITRIQTARPDVRLMLVQMEALPNYGAPYATAFHQLYVDLAKAHGLPLFPFLLDGVAGHPELNQTDGLHPNMQGERMVADNVWQALRPQLQVRR